MIDGIPLRWLVDGTVGHALADERPSDGLPYRTACGIATSKGRVVVTRPTSTCGRCRNALAQEGIPLEQTGAM